MKKLILSLLIFFSVISQAQIQIPQVVGLPAALSGKEAKLPSTPTSPESKFLNGNKQWTEIVLGSGGYASNVYFTNLTSTIVGSYKQTSGTHELTETIASGTCNNNEALIHTYLFEQPVGITTVDAGVWRFTMNCAISSNVGDSKFKIVQFRRSSTGVETDMFTIYSNTIENTDYQNFVIETVQPSFLVDSLDRFGCRIYATTTTTVNKIISYKVGDGYASYLNTPLVPRHDQFRALNGNPNVQHLTAAQVTKVNNTSGTNTGDETLTSIKTKLGAATSVSDGYLKYQDWSTFNGKQNALTTGNLTSSTNGVSVTNGSGAIIGTGAAINITTASASSGGLLSMTDWNNFNNKQPPGSYEPAFSKNTAFNKNFGTTPGTVLEGRTFGTAANSAVGDFILNQNSSAQSARMWINGAAKIDGGLALINRYDNSSNGSIIFNSGSGADFIFAESAPNIYTFGSGSYGSIVTPTLSLNISTRAATFSSTVNSTGFLLNGNNLTSSLTTNSIPKWNGSNFVNSLFSDNGSVITLTGGLRVGNSYAIPASGNLNVESAIRVGSTADYLYISNNTINPTSGLITIGGNLTASSFNGNGSNLTGVQLPITLTTNGTSGAATFSGNVLNVPNYGNNSVGAQFISTTTNISNISASSVNSSYYTKVQDIWNIAIGGQITPAASGYCTLRLSTPTISAGYHDVYIVNAFNSTGQALIPAYKAASGVGYIEISFYAPGTGDIGFTLMGLHRGQ